MNKKLVHALTFLILAVFLAMAAPAAAGLDTYTVGSSGSTIAQDTFSFDETPFLYMQLPNDELNFTSSFWYAPSGAEPFVFGEPGAVDERWLSLANWGTVAETGDWTIDSNVFYASGATATSLASFTVTPEPLSMVLFLVGGLPIATNLYRKTKRL